MEIASSYQDRIENEEGLYCFRCNLPLQSEKAFISYLQYSFPTQLLRCPKCGLTFVGEEMALTKAVEVEKAMEGK